MKKPLSLKKVMFNERNKHVIKIQQSLEGFNIY